MKFLERVFLALLLCVLTVRADAATDWVRLVTDDFEGSVLSINEDKFMVDIGMSLGARRGGLFLVYADGGTILDVNGAILGSYKIPLALLRARAVSATYSVCVAVPPRKGWAIQRGDRVVPISATRAKHLRLSPYRELPDPSYVQVYHDGYKSPKGSGRPAPTPISMIAKYDYYWTTPGAPVAMPATPGYYYTESPVTWPVETRAVRVDSPQPSTRLVHQSPAPVVAPYTVVSVPAQNPVLVPQTNILPPTQVVVPRAYAPRTIPVQQYAPPITQAPQPQLQVPTPQQYIPAPQYAQPVPQALPVQPQAEPPHPPFPPNPANYQVMLDFDPNQVADARVIRTLPLSQEEMNALEIQHRASWNQYENKRFLDAFASFSQQSSQYRGNYLSPYWAGMSALRLGNLPLADEWFNMALEINPYYQPARNAKQNGAGYISAQNEQQKKSAATATKKPVKKRQSTQKK
jgi:hypothetical protein